MYTLGYFKKDNDTLQSVPYTSLVTLIQQVKADFDNNVLVGLDQLVSVTYKGDDKQQHSAMVTVLQQLNFSATGLLKLEIKQRLDYLQSCC